VKYHAIGFLMIKIFVNEKQNMDRDVKRGEGVLG
jgi:hypothetical protein